MALYYGNTESTSGGSSFWLVCEYSSRDLKNGYYRYTYRFYVQVGSGNFYGTNVSTSWGTNFSMYGVGAYGHSSYYTKDVAYGSNFTLGSQAYAQYTASRTYISRIYSTSVIATAPRPTYTITYNANGGTGAPGKQAYSAGINTKLSTTVPTRTGYTFLGWSLSSVATSASYQPGQTWSGTNYGNYTLYAVWRLNQYTVVFDAGTNSGIVDGSQTLQRVCNHGTQIGELPIAERQNYNFIGWNRRADGSGSYIDRTLVVTGNEIFYAIFELAANCYVKVDGTYKTGMMYVKVDGTYKTGTVSVRDNGSYKETSM